MKKNILTILLILSIVTMLVACSPEVPVVDEDTPIENSDVNTEVNPEDTSEKEDSEKEPEKNEENKNEPVKNEETKNEETQKEEVKQPVASDKTPVKSEKSVAEIASGMVSVIPSDLHNLEVLPKELYKDIYGIDPDKFEDVVVYGTMINVKANEIIVVKVKDEADIGMAKSALEQRKNQVYKTWEQYLPDQFEMVKQGVIKTNGKYAALIISPEVSGVASQFINLTK